MNIGIIVYSQTGNTLSVAQKLEQALKAKGHSVAIERVETGSQEKPAMKASDLTSAPDVTPYDAVIFASPVHAFALAPTMKVYLSQMADLTSKQVNCFVTQSLKKAWMGGNRAIRKITADCRAKGATVNKSGIVHWSSPLRDQQIDDVVKPTE